MKLFNYLPTIAELDNKNQLKLKVRNNPLRKLWNQLKLTHSAEKLKFEIINKYKLQITTKTLENYIYKNTLSLNVAKVLIDFSNSYETWNELFEDMEAISFRNSEGGKTQWITLPKEITPDLLYFTGALRDGNVNLTSGRVFIAQKSNKKWLHTKIKPIFQRLFGITPTIDEKAIIYSFPVAYFLIAVLEHPPGKQNKWKTPSWISGLSINSKALYMKGYFDAEGTTNPKRMKISISQSWYRNEIAPSLVDIKRFLNEIGIKSSLEGPYRRNKNWSFMSNVVVYCKENPTNGIIFFEKIGCDHSDKITSLIKIYNACQSQLADSHNPAQG